MVSEDKNVLSKLQSVLQVGTTMMSHERVRCKGGRRIELTPRVYVFSCILNDIPSIEIRNENLNSDGASFIFNKKQWESLKSKMDRIDMLFN